MMSLLKCLLFQVIGACSGYLRNQLDLINCVDIITISETYTMPKLRRFAYNFFSENFLNVTRQQISRLNLDQVSIFCNFCSELTLPYQFFQKSILFTA